MKLQRQIASVLKGKKYSKWVVIIPSSKIDKLGWNEGDELESVVKGNTLLIKHLLNPPEKPKKMTYEEFRDRIEELLKNEEKGLSWTEIKAKLGFPQKVPNNLWVRMMERDIGLIREKVGTKTIWRVKI